MRSFTVSELKDWFAKKIFYLFKHFYLILWKQRELVYSIAQETNSVTMHFTLK